MNRTHVSPMIEQGVPIQTNRTYVSPMIEQGVPIQTNRTYVSPMIEQGVPIQTNRTHVSPMIEQGVPIQTNRTYVSHMNGVPIQTNRTYDSPMIEQGVPRVSHGTRHWTAEHWFLGYPESVMGQGTELQSTGSRVHLRLVSGTPVTTHTSSDDSLANLAHLMCTKVA